MLGTLASSAGGPQSLQGGAGGAAGPATSTSNSGFDSSGWNVSYGSGSISTDASGTMKWVGVAVVIAGALWLIFKKQR